MFAQVKPEQKQASKDTVQKKETEKSVASPNLTGIPDSMKTRFENLSGFSFDDVRVHYNSDKPAQLQALAYTQGEHVHIGPGQEKYLGHELGHVIQQKAGVVRPTTQISDSYIDDSPELERQADSIVQGVTSFNKLSESSPSGVIQRKATITLKADSPATTMVGTSSDGSQARGNIGSVNHEFARIMNGFGTRNIRTRDLASGSDGTYDRDAYMCAEPDAFVKMLKLVKERAGTISRKWFKSLNFSGGANLRNEFGKVVQENYPPCQMCQNWIEGEEPYVVKSDVFDSALAVEEQEVEAKKRVAQESEEALHKEEELRKEDEREKEEVKRIHEEASKKQESLPQESAFRSIQEVNELHRKRRAELKAKHKAEQVPFGGRKNETGSRGKKTG